MGIHIPESNKLENAEIRKFTLDMAYRILRDQYYASKEDNSMNVSEVTEDQIFNLAQKLYNYIMQKQTF